MSSNFAFEQSMRTPLRQINENDPIWSTTAKVQLSQQGYWMVDSARGGKYLCQPHFSEMVSHWSPIDKAKISTWVTDQERLGIYYPALHERAVSKIAEARPIRFGIKVDRFFEYLARSSYRVGEAIIPYSPALTNQIEQIQQCIMRWIEAANMQELTGFLSALVADELIEYVANQPRLTGKGMMRLDMLDQGAVNTDQVFVAMWFGEEMSMAYEEGIVPGLADAGYRAFRIDQSEHANKIDDEIIAEIRRSRFLVADFTAGSITVENDTHFIPRGGVYYEAGFAQGLGLPVIWTVRSDQINAVHFDTRQFNHIVWNDPEDLRVRLTRRVQAVIGSPGDSKIIVRS
ncbi:hypothetical protein [uncultured Sphingomonas sp.]|uniref:hypothetical protein n=1 Tax=uncultured Sphingomonas sp. TaxID=158754 RepID=UPI003748D253